MWGKVGGYWSNSSQGGLFSLHSFNEVYREQYTAQEITGYTGSWPSNRRCGYIIASWRDVYNRMWGYHLGSLTDEHMYTSHTTAYECRVDCPLKYGPLVNGVGITDNLYTTMCLAHFVGITSSHRDWQNSNTCPRGWGKSKWFHGTDYYSTKDSWGYINDNSKPVYSYITKYRTAYHNYITTRVAKA